MTVNDDCQAANKTLLPSRDEITGVQTCILVVAVFIKGGLLGAFLPFSTVWLDAKGYDAVQLAYISLVDSLGSLMLPLVGTALDKMRSHNSGFVWMLVLLSVLKLSYLGVASNYAALLCLAAVTAPLLRAANSVLDALALYAFHERGHFGRVRVFGDLGFGCIALFTGWALDAFRNVDSIFIIFAALSMFLAIFWASTRSCMTNIRSDSRQMSPEEFCLQARALGKKFTSPGSVRALVTLAVLGMGYGLISSFELVMLKHIGGSGLMLGGVKMWGTLCGIPVWIFMGSMLDRIGLLNVQLVGLVCMSVRLYILGVLRHPWQAFFSEGFAGLGGFAIAYCSITIFLGKIVDEDMKGTSQTIVFTIFAGVGAGTGPLIGGYYAETHGLQAMFLRAAVVPAVAAGLLLVHDVYRYFRVTYRTLEEELGSSEKANSV